jgi:predicted PurR-regulated permease PerM
MARSMEKGGRRIIREILPRQSQIFFFLILALLFFLTWLIFKPFVVYIVAGVFVAVLARPIDKLWERIVPNRVAAVLTIFSLFLLVTIPIVTLGIALFSDIRNVASDLQEGRGEQILNQTLDIFYPNQTAEERSATILELWGSLRPQIEGAVNSFVQGIPALVSEFFLAVTVILFVVYYILSDGERLISYIRRAAPLPVRQVDYLLREASNGLNAVFVGQILTSIIQGALGGIGFLIAGVPGAILWAAVMAILSLLPVVGAFIVWIPAAIYLFINGEVGWGFFLVGWGVLVVSQVDNFLRPKLIGDRADIHPIFVLLGVLGGVTAFGFIGLFLGPLLVGVTISVLKVWETEYLDPGLSVDASVTLPPVERVDAAPEEPAEPDEPEKPE